MSTTIDQRVVEMRFDNRQFENNVQTSLSTLDKLKQSLNLSGAAKGLESIGDASRTCDFSGLGSAVETVKVRFSALEVMAVTALTNIANSAVNTGKQLLKSLTTDQLAAGWNKYADKTSAVQTIMAATAKDFEDTGEQMDYVNEQLGKLNWFTDETSYNFLDMVSNIGKFTSNNIGLKESVTAMQGISTWAAISGANVNEAGRAMYNLSQAMAVGAVKLIDWKSIENANMATAEFKQTAIDTAVELGTLVKKGEGVYETLKGHAVSVSNFNDALSDAWFTADVLMATLEGYGGFTDKLYEASELTGLTATELLQAIDSYKNGELSIKKLADDTGVSVEELSGIMEALSDETFDLGERSFRAAQEAKTFREALDSVKDAVSTGWMNTFEIIFGDYEEAKHLWTDLANAMYDAFASGAETRNAILEEWKSLGGRDVLIEAFWNAWEGVASVIAPIREAFRDIFPEKTGQQLLELSKRLRALTETFRLSDAASENLKNTFKGFFAILDIVKQAFSAVFSAVAPLFGVFVDLSGGVLGVTGRFGELLVNLDEAIKKSGIFNKAAQGIAAVITNTVSAVKDFAAAVKQKFNLPGMELFRSLLERVHERMSQIREASGQLKSGVGGTIEAMSNALANSRLLQILEAVWTLTKNIAGGIAKTTGEFVRNLVGAYGNADFDGLLDVVNALSIGTIAVAMKNLVARTKESSGLFGSLKDFLSDIFGDISGILGGITGVFDSVRGSLEAFQNNLNASTLLKIAGAVGVLTASIVVLSTIDSDKLNTSLGAMTVMFADLMASMAVFTKISGDAKGLVKSSAAMMAVSAAVLILASALKKIGGLDVDQIAAGLAGIGGLTAIVVASAKAMSSSTGATIKAAASMVIFAEAVKILAGVCKTFTDMSLEEMTKGLAGVGVLLAEIDIFLNTAKFGGGSIATATGIVILAGAMKTLESACEDFAGMNWEEIAKGLVGIGAILAEVSLFTKATGDSKHVVSSALALIEIGAAMKIFASAMSDFGGMDWEEIAKGLAAMGGALAETALAVNLMPKNMAGIGTGLVLVGAALEIVADALGKMGNFSWEQIGKGLVVLGGALVELAVGLNLMTGTLAGSAAMLVAAGALAVLTPSLLAIGSMSWESIAKGLVTIAGAFAVLGAAGALFAPFVPVIAGMAGSFALMGLGALGVGAGLSSIAVGITALAASLGAGAAMIVASLKSIIMGIAAMIPDVAPAISEAIKTLILTRLNVLLSYAPVLADGALELIAAVLDALTAHTPQIIDGLMRFLIELIDGVAQHMPELIAAAVNLFMAFFSGIIDALSGIDTDILLKGIAGIGLLSVMMVALQGAAALVPGAMVGIIGIGAVIAELALVLAAIGALAQIPGLNWLIGEGGNLLQGIGTAIGSFVGGIAGGFMSGVSNQFPKIGADLAEFMTNVQPFIDGASSISPDMLSGVKALSEVILLLTTADILNGLTSWLTGGSSLTGFAEQLVPFGEAMTGFSKSVAGMDADLVSKAAIAGKTLAEMAATIPNSGGVVGFFTGENDMTDFGKQLGIFGEAMANFANNVKGMDADAVANAAIAGKAMSEMAATLPNSKGVIGFFAGENDMAAFAEQLVPFGQAIKDYSLAVNGLDTNAIANSATACKSLAELVKTVLNCGSLVSFFSGDNKLEEFGDGLTLFGGGLAAYAEAVKDVKPDVVSASANAAGALSNLTAGLPDRNLLDQWLGRDQPLVSFGSDIAQFGEAMNNYHSKISGIDLAKMAGVTAQVWKLVDLAESIKDIDRNMLSNFAESLSGLANISITGFTDAFSNCGQKVGSAVLRMLNSVSAFIIENKTSSNYAMEEVMNSLVNVVNEKTASMNNAAAKMIAGFGKTIRENGKSVKSIMRTVIDNAIAAINGTKSSFTEAGKNVSQGFINGINSKLSGASSAGRSLGLAALNAAKKALDSHSPSREFIYLGENIGEGLAIGVDNSIVPASQAVSEMIGEVIAVSSKSIDAFKEWADEKKYYGELSLKDELTGYETLQQQYKAGSEERKQLDREVYRLQNELVAATYQASIDWIEEEKYYNRLSLEEELDAYETIQARYLEGSDERKKADREVYRLRNELMKEAYENALSWIEEEKYYNRLTLVDELAAYKRIQSQYAAGTDERKKMDREVYRLEKEIYDAQKQYAEDVQRVYTEANQKRIGLEEEYADKVQEINARLAQDIEALNAQYEDAIKSRTDALYRAYGLFDEVKEKDEVSGETLMKNLEDQVREFSEWQDALQDLSSRGLDSGLLEELREMGPSAVAQIKALSAMSDSELEKYASLWSLKHAQAREQAAEELKDLRADTLDQIKNLRSESERELDEYRDMWAQQLDELNENTSSELAQLQENFGKTVGTIKSSTIIEMQDMTAAATMVLRQAGWDETGKQIVDGLTGGIENEKSNFILALTNLATSGVEAVKDSLGIHSPSRVFEELGTYSGIGFVNALARYADKSYDAGSEIAESAREGLSNSIKMVADAVGNSIDAQPVIRPVLDLTDVSRKADEINGLLGRSKSVEFAWRAGIGTNMPSEDQRNITVQNDDVVRELRSLRSEMSDMTEKLERMRIVLDTGTLVGELAGPMDSALGRKATYKGRGI